VYAVWVLRSLGWKEARPRLAGALAWRMSVRHPLRSVLSAALLEEYPGDSGRYSRAGSHGSLGPVARPACTVSGPNWHPSGARAGSHVLGASTRSLQHCHHGGWCGGPGGWRSPLCRCKLFLYLFAWHKLSPYLVHEVALFAGGTGDRCTGFAGLNCQTPARGASAERPPASRGVAGHLPGW